MEREIITSASIGLGLFAISFIGRLRIGSLYRERFRDNLSNGLVGIADATRNEKRIKLDEKMHADRDKFYRYQRILYKKIPELFFIASFVASILSTIESNPNLAINAAIFGVAHLLESLTYPGRLQRKR